jgi:aspartate dehydrogenase
MTETQRTIGLIGFGAIARALLAELELPSDPAAVSVLVTAEEAERVKAERPDLNFVTGLAEFMVAKPDLVVECASHSAVRELVPSVLRSGVDVVLVSVGALCNKETLDLVRTSAESGRAKLVLASGAIGGLDALRAARPAGLDSVCYIGRKPPEAWFATPASKTLDLSRLQAPVVIFEGSALEAATLYPKNANVAAAVALAGVGFDRTQVRLIADPQVTANVHEVTASGAFGSFHIQLTNLPLQDNPKTSWLAALSVCHAVRSHFSPLGG